MIQRGDRLRFKPGGAGNPKLTIDASWVSRRLPSSAATPYLLSPSAFLHTTVKDFATPESPELDESYRQLLEDVNFSFKMHQKHAMNAENAHMKDLKDFESSLGNSSLVQADIVVSEPVKSTQWKRKSAEARFGSDRVGQVRLPFELVSSMQLLIDETDKHQLRSDAKRVLTAPNGRGTKWIGDVPKYNSPHDERLRGPREGLAYAAITIPGQVSAIRAVLHEMKTRLPIEWTVKNVLDFGSQTGAAFWATLTFFGNQQQGWENHETLLKETSLKRYIALDNRKILAALAKKIKRDMSTGECIVMHKEFWRDMDEYDLSVLGPELSQTLAVSAFVLSQLPTPASRKQLVKEMWKSGAECLVIIDQGTKDGFNAVADAREYLLRIGGKNHSETGVHVVAPCPHDGACPLRATPDVCSFPQRFLRPDFQKKTKHAKESFENINYSYVVIRRGERPRKPQQAIPTATDPPSEDNAEVVMGKVPSPVYDGEPANDSGLELVHPELLGVDGSKENPDPGESVAMETERQEAERRYRQEMSDSVLQEHLRLSSYHWRRTIYPPMKGSGHITLDTCTPNGEIARIVIPRSQGKQDYHDARKASWGDLFPHEPRNGEVIRKRGIKRLDAVPSPARAVTDADEEIAMQRVLSALGAGDAFGERNAKGRPRLSKTERRESHRRRKEWRGGEPEDDS